METLYIFWTKTILFGERHGLLLGAGFGCEPAEWVGSAAGRGGEDDRQRRADWARRHAGGGQARSEQGG